MSDFKGMSEGFAAFGPQTEWWIIGCLGSMAFRFGPFSGPECGNHMQRALQDGIKFNIVGNCGRDVDWDLLRECSAFSAETCSDEGGVVAPVHAPEEVPHSLAPLIPAGRKGRGRA